MIGNSAALLLGVCVSVILVTLVALTYGTGIDRDLKYVFLSIGTCMLVPCVLFWVKFIDNELSSRRKHPTMHQKLRSPRVHVLLSLLLVVLPALVLAGLFRETMFDRQLIYAFAGVCVVVSMLLPLLMVSLRHTARKHDPCLHYSASSKMENILMTVESLRPHGEKRM